MEKLFLTKKIESEDEILMEMKNSSLSQLISKIKPTRIIGLTTQGQKITVLINWLNKLKKTHVSY